MIESNIQSLSGTATLANLPSMSSGEMVGLLIPLAAFVVGIIAILGWVIVSTNRTRERERTKRELSAYIAEGSMTPEQAERIIAADMPVWEKGKDWYANRAPQGSPVAQATPAAAGGCSNGKPKSGRITGINFDIANGKVGVTRG